MQNKIILQLLSNDLKQIEQLVQSMQESNTVDADLLSLAEIKAQSVCQSLTLLSKNSDESCATSTPNQEKNIEEESFSQKVVEEITQAVQSETKVEEVEMELLEEEPTNKPSGIEFDFPAVDTPVSESKPKEEKIVKQEPIQPVVEEKPEPTSAPEPVVVLESKEELVSDIESEKIKMFKQAVEEPIVEQELVVEEKTVSTTSGIQEEKQVLEESVKSEPKSSVDQKAVYSTEEVYEEKQLLGEQIKSEPKSLNDLFSSQTPTDKQFTTTKSIASRIGINDKFLFIRELFTNADHFQKSIKELDECANLEEAIGYMSLNFSWQKNQASEKFINLIKQRFPN